jgi:hypothetical protein
VLVSIGWSVALSATPLDSSSRTMVDRSAIERASRSIFVTVRVVAAAEERQNRLKLRSGPPLTFRCVSPARTSDTPGRAVPIRNVSIQVATLKAAGCDPIHPRETDGGGKHAWRRLGRHGGSLAAFPEPDCPDPS